MQINILHLLEGARMARGVAVIIDVFRAFSFECYLIRNHAEKIIPVASKELAYDLKRKNPGYILAGERKGAILPGFDYGNSPSQIQHIDFSCRTIVHTTSAGTQGLENAVHAEEILTGSLVNAKAVASYIKARGFDEVSLVCMGNEAVSPSEEDDLCALYIQSLLEHKEMDIREHIEGLKTTSGRKFFDPSRNHVFPEEDFALCTALDQFPFVLKFAYDAKGLGSIQKIDIQ